jgi:5'-nucleotidase (lipoprotein e(P4) family)
MSLSTPFRMEFNTFKDVGVFNDPESLHMQKQIYILIIGSAVQVLTGLGCQTEDKPTVPVQSSSSDKQSILALVYQQQAAEYRALCLQSYNLARRRVEESIRSKKVKELPLAVVTDLDETALDNSPYDVYLYRHDSTYSATSWKQWCDAAEADSVPGSVSFFNYVNSRKIDIFYVSNRSTDVLDTTINNMRKLGFPQLDKSHFYFRDAESSKEKRRQEIARTHTIVVLLGDNLIDLDARFDKLSTGERKKETDSLRPMWGDRYIVFPNAVYGDWENALYYDYQREHNGERLSQVVKDSIRLSLLHSYK